LLRDRRATNPANGVRRDRREHHHWTARTGTSCDDGQFCTVATPDASARPACPACNDTLGCTTDS
jgi:hypothetical protein